MAVHPKHLGAQSELIAAAWLLDKGYEVFQNVSPHGHIDLVAIRNGSVYMIDVKTCNPNRWGHYRRAPPADPAPGVLYLLVFPDKHCEWVPGLTRTWVFGECPANPQN